MEDIRKFYKSCPHICRTPDRLKRKLNRFNLDCRTHSKYSLESKVKESTFLPLNSTYFGEELLFKPSSTFCRIAEDIVDVIQDTNEPHVLFDLKRGISHGASIKLPLLSQLEESSKTYLPKLMNLYRQYKLNQLFFSIWDEEELERKNALLEKAIAESDIVSFEDGSLLEKINKELSRGRNRTEKFKKQDKRRVS